MRTHLLTMSLAAFVAAGGLLLVTLVTPTLTNSGVEAALAPTEQSGQIIRSTMLEDTVELPAGVYKMTIAELVFEPGSATVVHVHPGPSVGFVQDGRITVSIDGSGTTNSYSGGSAVQHPWYIPHVFRNGSDRSATMLSFELFPTEGPGTIAVPAS
jgi:quercetin dioxygenase-like cupin family protein